MAKKTIDNCTVIKKAIKIGIGFCGTVGDKCEGYCTETDDEPCDKCKRCKLLIDND